MKISTKIFWETAGEALFSRNLIFCYSPVAEMRRQND